MAIYDSIKNLSKRLSDFISNPDKFVYPFVIKEKNGKERTIITYNKFSNYGLSLRAVHEKIIASFNDNFAQRNINSFAYHKNVRCYDALSSHMQSNFFIKLDIHSFFESISEELFFERYGEYFNDDWKRAIKGLFYKGSLSIGFVSSPAISDFYMKDFDNDIENYLLEHPELHYSRYSDDILLSSELDNDESLKALFEFVEKELELFHLEINPKKTRKMRLEFKKHNSISYLGLNISKQDEINNKITISKRYILFLLFLIAKQKGYKDHCYPLDNEIKSRVAYLAYNSPISYARFQKKHTNIYGEPFNFVPKELEKRMMSPKTEEIPNYQEYASLFKFNIHKKIASASYDGFGINDAIEIESYLGKDKEVVEIPYFVDSIGPNSFANHSEIKEVKLNEKLKVIDRSAFQYCSKLRNINLPASLRYIGSGAFYNTDICKIEIPQYIKKIYSITFYFCAGLKEVILPEGLEVIDSSAFSNTGLYSVTFPESLKEIGSSAFSNCNYLESTNLGDSNVENIGNSAFSNCPLLTEAIIPNTTLIIGGLAFANNQLLRKAYISSSVLEISSTAFSNCPLLKSIEVDKDNKVYLHREDNSSIVSADKTLHFTIKNEIDKDIVALDDNLFASSLVKEIEIPEGVTSLGYSCFKDAKWLRKITLPSSLEVIGSSAFEGCLSLEEITIPNKVDKIPDRAFAFCPRLRKVNMGGNIKEIGMQAFLNCKSLEVDIPNGVRIIGQYAYKGCQNIKELYIPASVKKIKKDAFVGLGRYLESIKVDPYNTIFSSEGDTNTIIVAKKAYVLLGCKNSYIPRGIRFINKFAFAYVDGLEKISFPETLKEVKEGAFLGCSNLKEVDLNTINIVGKNAFKDTISLENIELPTSLTIIETGAFKGSSLKSLTLPDSISKLEDEVFVDMNNLEEINFSSTYSFGLKPFKNMPNLKRIHVDELNQFYDSRDNCNALIETKSKRLILGAGESFIPDTVTNISERAFLNNKIIEEITIPSTVEFMESNVFSGCTSLKRVNLYQQDRGKHPALHDGLFKGCVSLEEVNIFSRIEVIGSECFKNCFNLKTINLPDVVEINASAFEGCINLENVIVGENLKHIGSNAFGDCKKLKRIDLPNTLETIGYSAFSNCAFEEFILPTYLKILSSNVFGGCKNLKKVLLPNTLAKIDNSLFTDCESLEEVNVPPFVESIGSCAFYGCSKLKKIKLPDDLERIDSYAFKDCSSLEEIVIPKKVKSITISAFDGCTSLKKATLPNILEVIPTSCFYKCSSLKEINFPTNLKRIGQQAFYKCTNLAIPAFNDMLEEIDSGAFAGIGTIKEVNLPASLELIYNNAFADSSIEHINIDKNNPVLSSLDGDLISYVDSHGYRNLLLASNNTKVQEGMDILSPYAFYDVKGLKKLDLPDSLKIISHHCFTNNHELEEINLPNNLLAVGSSAFSDCENVKNITLNEGLKEVQTGAFDRIAVDKIHIPSSVQKISLNGLSFNEISVDENNDVYSDFGCNLLGFKLDRRVVYTSTDSKIPDNVNTISSDCYYNHHFDKIIFPETLNCLGGCFENCGNIEEVRIPKDVNSIGGYFADQTFIKKFIVDENNCYFSTNKEHTALLDITGRKLLYTADEARIPEGVTSVIGSAKRNNVKKLFVPSTLVVDSFFNIVDLEQIEEVEVAIDNPVYRSFDNNAIVDVLTNTLVFAVDATKIPECVERIPNNYHLFKPSVTKIFIPKNVKHIARNAFTDYEEIEEIAVDKENKVFDSRDNCSAIIVTKKNTAILTCKNTKLPDDVYDCSIKKKEYQSEDSVRSGFANERVKWENPVVFNTPEPVIEPDSTSTSVIVDDDDLPF